MPLASLRIRECFNAKPKATLEPNEDSNLSNNISTVGTWMTDIAYRKFQEVFGFTDDTYSKCMWLGRDDARTMIKNVEAIRPGISKLPNPVSQAMEDCGLTDFVMKKLENDIKSLKKKYKVTSKRGTF